MNSNITGTSQPASGSTLPEPARRGGGFGRAVLKLLVLLLVALVAWTWFSLSWAYSEGDRAGVLQKFSRKGWLCKTWEGEIAQYVVAGVAPRVWLFSVRDPVTAEAVSRQVGRNVQLHYSEHVGVPTSCFAETAYFVQRVTVMSEGPFVPGAVAPAAPAVPPPAMNPSTPRGPTTLQETPPP